MPVYGYGRGGGHLYLVMDVAGGGDLYVPTPDEKAAFKEAAAPVYDWFKDNVDGGERIFDALVGAVAEAEEGINATRMADIK